MWKYVLAWLPMVLIAMMNGTLRQMWYGRYLSELRAHQVSTVTGILLFAVYIWFVIRTWRPGTGREARGVGLIWLGMTVAFEFLFMHYALGHPWSRLFHDYNLLAGRVWLLVLIWITVAPYLFYRLQE